MTEFVIHVGPHKTGSTYIQLGLDRVFPLLLQHGVAVPTEWRHHTGNPSHTGFVDRLNPRGLPSLQRDFDQFAADGYSKVVISAEALSLAAPETLAMIRQLAGAHKLTIVFYVRRWTELMASAWNEATVQGGTETFPEYMLGPLRDPYASPRINIGVALAPLLAAFGKDSIRLVSYNEVIARKRDLFVHFVRKFLGPIEVEALPDGPANRSFDWIDAEILRLLNAVDRLEGMPHDARNATAWREKIQTIDIAPLREKIAPFEKILEIDDGAEPFGSILAANRRDFAAQFTLPLPDKTIYATGPVSLRYCAGGLGLTQANAEMVADLRARLHATETPAKTQRKPLLGIFAARQKG